MIDQDYSDDALGAADIFPTDEEPDDAETRPVDEEAARESEGQSPRPYYLNYAYGIDPTLPEPGDDLLAAPETPPDREPESSE